MFNIPSLRLSIPLYQVDKLYPLSDLSEYDVLLVQPGAENCCYVELAPVAVLFSVVSHGHSVAVIVPVEIVFILKSLSVYTLTTCTISMSNIPTLYHKSRDNPMESTAFIVQILPTLAFSLFSCAKGTEILGCDRSIIEKLDFQPAQQ